jgi:hypothetical protein
VKACQRLNFELQHFSLDLEQVTTMLSVSGKEMKVVAVNAEGACESRRCDK